MLKRHWGILLTLGIAAVGTPLLYIALEPGQPNLPGYEHAERGNPNYQTGGSRCQPSVLAAIGDSREAASERERCAKEAEDHRLQSNDLVQQARAADAAQAQARLAYDVAWMVVYGTIGGFLTLLAASAAAFYARDAARAGKDSLAHARRVSAQEFRPYLISDTMQIAGIPHSNGTWEISFLLKNDGRSPALILSGKIGRGISNAPAADFQSVQQMRSMNEGIVVPTSGSVSFKVQVSQTTLFGPIPPPVTGSTLVMAVLKVSYRGVTDDEATVYYTERSRVASFLLLAVDDHGGGGGVIHGETIAPRWDRVT